LRCPERQMQYFRFATCSLVSMNFRLLLWTFIPQSPDPVQLRQELWFLYTAKEMVRDALRPTKRGYSYAGVTVLLPACVSCRGFIKAKGPGGRGRRSSPASSLFSSSVIPSHPHRPLFGEKTSVVDGGGGTATGLFGRRKLSPPPRVIQKGPVLAVCSSLPCQGYTPTTTGPGHAPEQVTFKML